MRIEQRGQKYWYGPSRVAENPTSFSMKKLAASRGSLLFSVKKLANFYYNYFIIENIIVLFKNNNIFYPNQTELNNFPNKKCYKNKHIYKHILYKWNWNWFDFYQISITSITQWIDINYITLKKTHVDRQIDDAVVREHYLCLFRVVCIVREK